MMPGFLALETVGWWRSRKNSRVGAYEEFVLIYIEWDRSVNLVIT